LSADKEHLQAHLADVEALRIMPLYKSIDSLTADIGRLEAALDVKRGKKQAYKSAFTGKVS